DQVRSFGAVANDPILGLRHVCRGECLQAEMERFQMEKLPHADEPDRSSARNRYRAQGLVGRTVESHGAKEFHTSRSDREQARSRFLGDRKCHGCSSCRFAHRRRPFTTASRRGPEELVGPAAQIQIASECCWRRFSATNRSPYEWRRNVCKRRRRPILHKGHMLRQIQSHLAMEVFHQPTSEDLPEAIVHLGTYLALLPNAQRLGYVEIDHLEFR